MIAAWWGGGIVSILFLEFVLSVEGSGEGTGRRREEDGEGGLSVYGMEWE